MRLIKSKKLNDSIRAFFSWVKVRKPFNTLTQLLILISFPIVIIFVQPQQNPYQLNSTHKSDALIKASSTSLPGEQLWGNRISSYIFGGGDTGEWGAPNLEFTDSVIAPGNPNTAVQNLVKHAGFTLIRKFIDHHDLSTGAEMTDAELRAMSNTFVNTNTQCLAVLSADDINASSKHKGDTYTDLQFAEHVVTLFDGNHAGYTKCSMFEIGNEPDINGVDVNQYLTIWNTFVPALKQLRPDAKFIGPVVAGYDPNFIIGFLSGVVQNHYQIPDAISWHYYPCGWGSEANWNTCLADMSISTQPDQDTYFNNIVHEVTDIRAKIQSVLGYQIPIGVTEWSVDASGNMQDTEPQYSQFVTQVLNDMISSRLDFAAIFDLQSEACYTGCDIIDASGNPKPSFNAFVNVLRQYKPSITATPPQTPTSSIHTPTLTITITGTSNGSGGTTAKLTPTPVLVQVNDNNNKPVPINLDSKKGIVASILGYKNINPLFWVALIILVVTLIGVAVYMFGKKLLSRNPFQRF